MLAVAPGATRMGIDDVDRAFRKPVIRLECVHCGAPGDSVRSRVHWYYADEVAVLCRRCWDVWVPPREAG
jgi:hypothetical protein